MEFSEIFSFLTILKESMTLLPKIWKITTTIAAISLILSSFFFLIFSYLFQTMTATAIDAPDSIFLYMFILLAAEIVFFAVYIALSHLSGISTIIASAMAYTDQRVSPSDLLSRVRKTSKSPLKTSFRMSRESLFGVVLLGICVAFATINNLINVVTISLFVVLSILLILYQLKASVARVLAHVAFVVEEISDGEKAAERGEQLAEGQRLKGFMMNLFMNILVCACFLVFWMIVGDKGSLNVTIYGLFFLISLGLAMMYMWVTATVFYFQCRKHHGEERDVVGAPFYTKLPASV